MTCRAEPLPLLRDSRAVVSIKAPPFDTAARAVLARARADLAYVHHAMLGSAVPNRFAETIAAIDALVARHAPAPAPGKDLP